MRDPLTWSLPLGRLFGITIRLHILFPVIALALILRVAFNKDYEPGLWVEVGVLVVILFFSVLVHEFGHCFAARWMEGDATDILMWPLGGLAYVEVPHTPRANLIVAAAGPAVNIVVCLLAALALMAFSLVPPLNPWTDIYRPRLYNWSEQIYYGSKYARGDLKDDGAKPEPGTAHAVKQETRPVAEPAQLTWPRILLARIFWVNWVLTLLNLVLVGFPMDMGRIFQCALWPRFGYRQATLAAVYAGFVTVLVLAIYAIVVNDVLPAFLALFIYVTCKQQWILLETGGEESLFGYDFSQGYTSLERDQPLPPPRRRPPNFFKRWLQRRQQRKQQQEQERRESEERRMDELLEKVQRQGLQALTDEERRFLTRVSARYRNRH